MLSFSLLASAPFNVGPFVLLGMVLIAATGFIACSFISRKKAPQAPAAASHAPIPAVQLPTVPAAPGSAGTLKLHDVPPKTAAMLMAIVANKMECPLNELRFTSIREVK